MEAGTVDIVLVAGILAAAAALAGLMPSVLARSREEGRLRQRVERVTRSAAMKPVPATSSSPASVRREPVRAVLGRLGRRLLPSWPRAAVLRQRLEWAGIGVDPVDFVALCLAAGAGAAATVYLAYGLSWLVAAGLGTSVATGLPRVLIGWRIAKRQQRFVSDLPDAIDLIVRGVKSGLPVTEALQTAGQELPNAVGELFQEVTGQIQLGKGLDEALALAAQDVQPQEFKFFTISLAIQQETGGNLSEILQNLSHLIRRREQVKLKIKAMSSEARASAYIIGSLPFIMLGLIYMVDPDYVMKLFVDRRGWVLLGAGAVSLGLGLGIMKSMVRFEI
jgi:tight adherence protein B